MTAKSNKLLRDLVDVLGEIKTMLENQAKAPSKPVIVLMTEDKIRKLKKNGIFIAKPDDSS